MQFRRSLILGLSAAIAMGSTAFAATSAGTASPASVPAVSSDVVKVAAKSPTAELKLLKKKKSPTAEDQKRIKELEARIKADKEVAKAKIIEAKKLAMRTAAKERADKAREEARARKSEKKVVEVAQAKPQPKRELPVRQAIVIEPEPLSQDAVALAASGNNGELRSEPQLGQPRQQTGLLAGLFGGSSAPRQAMLPQTRALDQVLDQRQAKKQFKVKSEFEPQTVDFPGYKPGQIVVDTGARYLYLIESSRTARRYAIAVGREGLEFKGSATIGDKQEWPRWIPTKEMQEREPRKYGQYKDGMNGGPDNPLGARAIYLYQGKKDTHIRIHGTNQPQTIGTNSSNGCFRMVNDHVRDLYGRVKMGSEVIVM